MFHRYILSALGTKPVYLDRALIKPTVRWRPCSLIVRQFLSAFQVTALRQIQATPDSCAASVRRPVVGDNMHAREQP